MTVLGPAVGVALGRGEAAEQALRLGLTLTASAFGVLPFAIVMLQLRVFYAMKDARTPTVIMLLMMAVKVPLSFLCPVVLESNDVVYGLAFVNSLSFVAGTIIGEFWLRSRLGPLGTGRMLRTLLKTLVACAWGGAGALLILIWLQQTLGAIST